MQRISWLGMNLALSIPGIATQGIKMERVSGGGEGPRIRLNLKGLKEEDGEATCPLVTSFCPPGQAMAQAVPQ